MILAPQELQQPMVEAQRGLALRVLEHPRRKYRPARTQGSPLQQLTRPRMLPSGLHRWM